MTCGQSDCCICIPTNSFSDIIILLRSIVAADKSHNTRVHVTPLHQIGQDFVYTRIYNRLPVIQL